MSTPLDSADDAVPGTGLCGAARSASAAVADPPRAPSASHDDREHLAAVPGLFGDIRREIAKAVEGKQHAIDLTLACLFAGGHLLIEDIPGVGKTMLAKALGRTLGADQHRIQFTPDLLPSDITGVSIFNQATRTFEFRPGAVFAHIVLADEINRASPKTQSSLLEAMEELQVTVDAATYPLPSPFMVIATSNPVEMDGTFRLPEAQRDRFLARISLGYPDASAEAKMLAVQTGPYDPEHPHVLDTIDRVSDADTVTAAVHAIRSVHVAPDLLNYVVRLADRTREHPQVELGASPRAGVHLVRAAKSWAALHGADHVAPEDIRTMLAPVWQHRLHVSASGASRGATVAAVLHQVLDATPLR